MNMEYFAYDYGLTMTNDKFARLFGAPPRQPESKLTQREMDLAATVQKVTETVVLKMAHWIYNETKLPNLCMAGGVALNCVANGKILRETPFEEIFIQPAAGDAGGAVGVAALIWHSILDNPRTQPLAHSYLGPAFHRDEIKSYLDEHSIVHQELPREAVLDRTAQLIEEQNVIGWFQGRMEFGPRALGNRSILADARNPENKDIVNMKIKFREGFRPFAPSVLEERVADWFELDKPSPYMLLVAQVREDHRSIPSVTHVDGSARIRQERK
jgi:carbamoyltransferase